MKKENASKIMVVLMVVVSAALFFAFDLEEYFTLTYLKSSFNTFEIFYADHTLLTICGYMGIYIVVTALSLPGATVMTLAGGALFGLWTGLVLVSFASTIGATLAFLVSRFLFRDAIQKRFGDKLETINSGIQKEGGFYLFTLRLVPLFPFFVINIAMGLTPLSTTVFYGVSQVGMLAGTFVYVNAGTQLAKMESISGILSPQLIGAFALLGIFPIVAKRIIAMLRAKKAMAGFTKPKRFDYNLVVIGAGAAGLVASYIAATVKAKVALIEKDKMGGDCLNTGCVPSKALIKSAKILHQVKRAETYGFKQGHIDFRFSDVMERVQRIVKQVEPHDSVERYTKLGVDCIKGNATIKSPYEVAVNGRVLTTRSILIASGAKPFVPAIPGLDRISFLTSDSVWDIRERPGRLLVLGGGPIGCELSQAFARLGSTVTLVQRGKQLMKREDPDVAQVIKKQFESEGITVLTGHAAKEITVKDGVKTLICNAGNAEVSVEFDAMLIALGRVPNLTGFGLEALGVQVSRAGTIETNEFLETTIPTIYCSGDVAGPYQFTHTAAHQSWYTSVNALFGRFKKFRVDYSVIPWATYTDPEVARVGLNESEAAKKGIAVEVTLYGIDDLDRAITDSEDHGFVKVLTPPGKDKILGVTIVGCHAGEIIAEFVFAMKHGLGLNKILGTIHIYPTLAEANKYAAGAWKKAHAPEKLLGWVEKYHTWMRH